MEMANVIMLITDFISSIFLPLGLLGGLICIFILFFIDAIVFPTLPELFTILIFSSFSTQKGVSPFLFGGAILITIVTAEIAGLSTLYFIVKHLRVPKRVHSAIKRYQSFLIYPDERMILVNRVAPILPFLGAFVALCDWDYFKSVKYTIVGGLLKYGAILFVGGVFITVLAPDTAVITTIIMVLLVIIIGFIISFARKKGIVDKDENRTT